MGMSVSSTPRTGWTSIPNWMLDDPEMPTVDKVIYLLLSSHLAPQGIEAWPSQALLAERVGASVDTVQRSLKRLRKLGVVSWVTLPHNGGRRNIYFINVHPRDGLPDDRANPVE